ncbi:MAG: hypothetical protein QF645_01925 [Planctomycetota bacterium]|jgi:hypothetical protein|nr:hypothetical protein [Planctomycetota bacterium]
MKIPILLLLAFSGAFNVLSGFSAGDARTIEVSFLPDQMTSVPYTYFFGTLAALFCSAGIILIGRGWERDSLSKRFIQWTKAVALVELSLSFLPAMIFIGRVIQEI